MGNEVSNFGTSELVLLADFINAIQRLTGQKAKLVPTTLESTDISLMFTVIQKAFHLLDYEPRIRV